MGLCYTEITRVILVMAELAHKRHTKTRAPNAAETPAIRQMRELLEAGYKLRNKIKRLWDEKPFDEKWTSPTKEHQSYGTVGTRKAWDARQKHLAVKYPWHPAYLPPDENADEPVQQEMTNWRKDATEQARRLCGEGRESDPFLELLLSVGAFSSFESAGSELYATPGTVLKCQMLNSERIIEALDKHVQALADEFEQQVDLKAALSVEIKFDFPGTLKRARLRRGETQDEAAERMEVAADTVKAWENGRRRPESDKQKVAANYIFGAPPPNSTRSPF